ncbi:glucosaminidase domain-containing protein [Parabacteroides acidifaciens]|uniref:Glucosaminidase n=1 Tax=Parabacteroides acidifaciens TaxID=2290935 RepID=A0A3D8H8L2_9BACT|nr:MULTISPECIES: glucosaminidase domain-containing protein [Parabacteroides]MBC8603937.1 glucosaminidase domain-containing protein [Parabacteroides acidifaciens]RDU47319.1 glucosaminidase [Parabacteroides acidifaciens]RHO63856.1 glucosaminidase [Parabacteroides sp. AF48-14]
MEKGEFVKGYGGAARMAGELYGMNPVVILAQAAIESGWGESTLAVKYHNFFGITGYGVTNAYWHGGKTDLGSGGLLFRRYDTPEHSFLDFARLVFTAYPQAAAVSAYPAAYAQEIAYSRYISEVNGDNRAAYRKMLVSIARQIQLLISN